METTSEHKTLSPMEIYAQYYEYLMDVYRDIKPKKKKRAKQKHSTPDFFNMPITDKSVHAKKQDKSSGQHLTPWITGGPLGSKETVLVFRTCVLSSHNLESESFHQDANSCTNNTTTNKSHNNTKDVLAPLPKNINIQRPSPPLAVIDVSNVSSSDSSSSGVSSMKSSASTSAHYGTKQKTKKRHLESSPSSSSLSNFSSCDSVEMDNDLATTTKGKLQTKSNTIDDKENLIIDPIDKSEMPGAIFNICYKFMNTETRLLRKILSGHGLIEVGSDCHDFNLLWTGIHIKPDILRNLSAYQRVNHFPRSYELTRKDRLYKNIERMQHSRGYKHFDIVPQSFLLPADFKDLVSAHNKNRGPWIVKPVASSRGRGIFIVNSPDSIPPDEQVVVAKYIADPLCIDGHKCDIRVYVAVTSFDPLLIYIYEEGLVRLATVKYDRNSENLWNPCMHLCNYSINKYHTDYIKSDNAGDEDVGHKWTLSALLRHLRSQGCNTEQLMANIEDLIIKAILACTQPIVSACRMFVPNFGNCFELYGFDILIDDTLKPWLLEVNLSPSLGCDSPLDTKVKACLLTDLLTLVGIPALSPLMKATYDSKCKTRSLSSYRRVNSADFVHTMNNPKKMTVSTLTAEESRIVKAAKAQYERHGGFVRVFPTTDSYQKYGMFLDPVTGVPCASGTNGSGTYLMIIPHNYNLMLHQQLFPVSSDNQICNTPSIIDRIDRYERALRSSAPISLGPKNSSNKCIDEARRLRLQLRKLIENGHELSILQARRAFGMYLEFILKRLSQEPKHHHEELILKFLYKAGLHMRQPFFIRNFSHKVIGKDRGALVAKQLGDYLHIYNKDTEAYVDSFDRIGMVPIKIFDDFLSHANESDLENILTLHTNCTQQMPFLYSGCNANVPQAPPIPVGAHGFLKALPNFAPGPNKDFSRLEAHSYKTVPRVSKANGKSLTEKTQTTKLSPTKKKITLYSSASSLGKDRLGSSSAW